jgi:VanZ family protein
VADAPTRLSLWGPVLFYLLLIFSLSSVAEVPPLPLPAVVSDKDLHAVLYCGLGLLLTRALSGGFRSRVTVTMAVLVTILATLYGISDEFHQSFVPPRTVDRLDVAADMVGGAIASFGCYAWGIIRSRNGL